jgi:hypothetical protein
MNESPMRDAMTRDVDVVVGAPVYRRGLYAIDKFLSNQRAIQLQYPACELVLATNEVDLVEDLEHLLGTWELRGKVIPYETVRPEHARSWVWNVACGREAIRHYTLSLTEAACLLSVDTDMLYDPAIIMTMKDATRGYDVVFSGYPMRSHGIALSGGGCIMMNRKTLEKVRFRCLEFRNGGVLSEDNLLEMDAFRRGCRIKKGFFLSICHYVDEVEVRYLRPQPVGVLRKMANAPYVRYMLISASILVRYNIPLALKALVNRATRDAW